MRITLYAGNQRHSSHTRKVLKTTVVPNNIRPCEQFLQVNRASFLDLKLFLCVNCAFDLVSFLVWFGIHQQYMKSPSGRNVHICMICFGLGALDIGLCKMKCHRFVDKLVQHLPVGFTDKTCFAHETTAITEGRLVLPSWIIYETREIIHILLRDSYCIACTYDVSVFSLLFSYTYVEEY